MKQPRIAILDAYTTNPGDVSWEALEALGDVFIYERSSLTDIAPRIADIDIAVSNKIIWNKELLDKAPNLKMIALLSTGYNVVDLEETKARGIIVSNVPAYSTPDVAQHTFALLLELTTHVGAYAQSVRNGAWITSIDFTYQIAPLVELAHKTFGIIGMGSIGSSVARIARAFDMDVMFFSPHPKHRYERDRCHQVRLDTLLQHADIVSLHCSETTETRGLVNEEFIAKMKDGAYLLNTARGGLLDEHAVSQALRSGKLAGFGADVMSIEPMKADSPLRCAPNTVITPHIAWATKEARERLISVVASNIASFVAGNPENIV